MNVFVTTGTTSFSQLVDASLSQISNVDLIIQSPSVSSYSNSDFLNSLECFPFTSNIKHYYDWADVIITHAGAGTVYNLLEKGKKVIVVPNLTRRDKHQLDLATFLFEENLCEVCFDLNELGDSIASVTTKKFNRYRKDDFSGVDLILELLD
ncbi:glycosyltransferase [Photobacterium galatheae]|uniref:PssE/Cps14G family polysaccharide biosynthesis glycosyltransferase n=1 Tax=Photobacterium galatheae TaxID=1654360 RepID=UPI00202CD59D|nr:PssE/Cps14G family polysaccharide biosynthesis glycosyltransferase [Photobacterium galatheae]MCM0147562.1 glycosyltransferase [Photobacterium galatheae]